VGDRFDVSGGHLRLWRCQLTLSFLTFFSEDLRASTGSELIRFAVGGRIGDFGYHMLSRRYHHG
jgi:hypothetical protein